MIRHSIKLLAFLVALATLIPAAATRAQMAAQTNWSSATPLTITLSSYEFAPAQLALQHGMPYRLHLVNAGGKGHNFSAPELFNASTVAPADQKKIEHGAVEVDGGSSVDIEFVPLSPGAYKIKCTHFLHETFGMHATATVS
jgi:uncharacterized cupredoxin-like copper-binding protein